MKVFATTDLCDLHGELVQVAAPVFRRFGGTAAFCGAGVTLKVFEDNSLVRSTLEEPGQGRVLVVDGGGSLRCALVGDQLGELAVRNGWAGIVVNGCVRDTDALSRLDLGILALAGHPLRSVKRGEGQRDLPVRFADVTFTPGHWIYVDSDGLLVAPHELS